MQKLIRIISLLGLMLIVVGGWLHLQGRGLVGPEASFMFQADNWRVYGVQIMVGGSLLILMAVWMISCRPPSN